ncbi:MAG TPA: DUF6714 family protein [Tepidisphaeraceae bacterium]|jgi:hypothetical protein|nr:DUF6714 family protein [Tepidisphaeraceae bacterium]
MHRYDVASLIETAFADAPRPGDGFEDISATKQDEGIVEYFRGTTWRGHDIRDLRYHSAALSFFTDAAFRYWLPAFMLGSIEDAETADVIPESIQFHFRDGRKAKLFTRPERAAIAAFLHEFARRWDASDFQRTADQIGGFEGKS